MSNNIVVAGSLNMDLVVYAPRQPRIGETILGERFRINPGGKGANQAVAAVRLGAAVTMIGKVGDDQFGADLLANLESNGVRTEPIQRDQNTPTGVALITIDSDGDNSIIVVPGSNMNLSRQDIEQVQVVLSTADILLLQLEIPIDTSLYAAQIAKSHGAKIILNPSPAQALPSELLDLVDILVLNESETAHLAGIAVADEKNLVHAARELKKMIPGDVVLTLGDQGSMWVGKSKTLHLPAIPVIAADTTAAGDAFIGGMAVALLENQTIVEALRLGNAAGALTVTQKGAQSSLPDRERCQELLITHPFYET
jgi:ribokinase